MSLVSEHHSDVKNIVCPTLIIHGTKDEIVPDTSVNIYMIILNLLQLL